MIKNSRFAIVYIMLLLTALFINSHAEISVPMNRSFQEFPISKGVWKMKYEAVFSEEILSVLRPTDYMSRTYSGPGRTRVDLYIGYHSGGDDSGPIHSPKNCLPGGGWEQLSEEIVPLEIGSSKIDIVKAIYNKGDSKELFFYWYKVKGKTLYSEYDLKAAQIVNSALHRRKDAAFIRVSVPFEDDEDKAVNVGTQFIQDYYSVIEEFLPE